MFVSICASFLAFLYGHEPLLASISYAGGSGNTQIARFRGASLSTRPFLRFLSSGLAVFRWNGLRRSGRRVDRGILFITICIHNIHPEESV